MKHSHPVLRLSWLIVAALACTTASAQVYTENFTGTTTQNSWTFINGACLTEGTVNNPAAPGCVALPYYNGSPNPQFGGDTGVLPDTTSGALRFTDWYAQNGAILSNFSFALTGQGAQGLQVSFTTVTYEGDSGGGGSDGADGMSFFLQDATYAPDVGAWGGSLGYTCTNVNYAGAIRADGRPRGFDGLGGGYIGLGIDEYGNFMNQGDNTATGWHYVPGRIGLRGPGNVTWSSLSAAYPVQYPATLTNPQTAQAVQYTCRTGKVWDFSNPGAPVNTGIPVADYPAMAYSLIPAGKKIANEAATTRAQAVPIVYNLSITPGGLLSLQYSYNGGAYQNVITNQDITNGGLYPIPSNVRFGFAGSTGGSRNIHEIMCFQATPQNQTQSSAGVNSKQTAKVDTGTQVYFAYYDPVTLAGSVTSQYIGPPVGDPNPNDLIISSTVNWDGGCVLTGVPAGGQCDAPNGPAGPIAAEGPASRTIFTWSAPAATGGSGIPFEWANITGAEQALLDSGDGTAWIPAPPFNYSRLDYLRGDRSNEQTPSSAWTYVGTFRDRTSVLGDVIDSSPTWVGPPQYSFPNLWADLYQGADPLPENSGQTYGNYVTSMQQRTNVVYVGANDGMLHAFRSGYFSSPTQYQPGFNDGYEMFAYMPGYILETIQTATSAASNFSDPQYGHHYDVDASPGTGDVFYQGQWHTWLVGGLGAGGNAIYALDITNPGMAGSSSVTEANATSTVIGEWSTLLGATNLTCANDSGTACGTHLGNTYGVPQIRRFHNGSWGAVFAAGPKSAQGDAGIFVMLIDPVNGPGANGSNLTFYYFSTGVGAPLPGVPDAIYAVSASDLDGDHITDYVYAGDSLGNVWRFDFTSANPAQWGVINANGVSVNQTLANGGGGAPTPIFTAPAGQPITTQVVGAIIANNAGRPRVLIEFGTGQQKPMGNTTPASYATGQQAIYGVWDWNYNAWNSHSATQFDSLPNGVVAAPGTLSGTGNLVQQMIGGPFAATVANTGTDYRTLTSTPVCWADTTGCSQYGWFINLVSGNAYSPDPADPISPAGSNPQYAAVPVVYEQITFNPSLIGGALLVNTTIPPASAATMCFSALQSGWTMAINPATGGAFVNSVFETPQGHNYLNIATNVNGSGVLPVSGIAFSGTGSISVIAASGGQQYMTMQTIPPNGTKLPPIKLPGTTQGSRLTWIEKR
ncbi:MAG TPA: PilC/PilY family type IV pilus protein [Steroidobacteraceae bacterium]|nr:PilC/PilY family type IV pilus protein [Steroidobacteraceae bacterium]